MASKALKQAGNYGVQGMMKDGAKHLSGVEEAMLRNIEACKELSNITRTSMGPNGMNKMVINHLNKLFVTSDCATIVAELEVMHPAAKMIVMAAQMQEQEYGDGSNFVVTFGGELLMQAEDLIRMGLHPSEIIAGYLKALEKANELAEGLAVRTFDNLRDADEAAAAIRAVICSKQYGYEDFLCKLVAKACIAVMPPAPKAPAVNVDNVRVCKLLGGSLLDSKIVNGMVVSRQCEGAVKHVTDAKVAVFSCAIDAAATETKGTVLIEDATELLNYSKGEERALEEQIKAIADCGVKVIVAGGTISEMAMHFIEKYEMLAIRIISKFELRRVCRTAKASAMVRVGAPLPEEMGHFDEVKQHEIGGRPVILLTQNAIDSRISTIIIRGSTQNLLDDFERAIDDGVNACRALCRDPRVFAGAGAFDIELARLLAKFGESAPGLDQYAIKKFATSLEVVPRILAENAGIEATSLISSLYAAHENGNVQVGVDIENQSSKDMTTESIYDSVTTKLWALRLAADAAITVMRVDQIIMSKPAGGPKPREGGPNM